MSHALAIILICPSVASYIVHSNIITVNVHS